MDVERVIMRRFHRGALAASLALVLAACGADDAQAPTGSANAQGVAAADTTRDWTQVVAATPEGGFRIGNPDAPVKLLEFASLQCSHCADFHKAAMASLKRDYIASGRVSYELRNFVLSGPDLAVSLLARCQGPQPFFRLADALFENQKSWIEPFTKLTEADYARMRTQPAARQTVALADAGNIDDFMRLRGMPRARYEACLTDQKAVAQLEAIRGDAVDRYQLQGTPTFVINGETRPEARNWPTLEIALKAALR